MMEPNELKASNLRNINNISVVNLCNVTAVKDLLYIPQSEKGFQKAEVTYMSSYFCITVQLNHIQVVLKCFFFISVVFTITGGYLFGCILCLFVCLFV